MLTPSDEELLKELSRRDVKSCRIEYNDGTVVDENGLLLLAAELIRKQWADLEKLRRTYTELDKKLTNLQWHNSWEQENRRVEQERLDVGAWR